MSTISETLDPNRTPREEKGLEAKTTLYRISFTPSSTNPGETLYIHIPKLMENAVIVPGIVYFLFNLNVSGHEDNTLVNNVGRNLVSRLRVLFGGETLQDTQRFNFISNLS